MWKSVFAITLGAALGALLRWSLSGLKLNALFPAILPGTLAANLIGGCVICHRLRPTPEWRQTVFHMHLHLIPRYRGGVAAPCGGVRGVIPSKQNY
jgi:fluoride ion exporter CrcB/FEX